MPRYVVLNPVRARLVARPEHDRWSSYRAMAGYEAAPPWLATDWALQQFGPHLPTQQRNYRTFVDEGAVIVRSPFGAAVGQMFLGRPSVDKIIEVVAGVFMDNPREIRQRHPDRPSL